ncbi:MAG: ATP-binding cassette domain-containing protein [Chitinophagaceae bacterium]
MKCMVGLFDPDEGEVLYSGQNFTQMKGAHKTEIRKEIGMLFQGSALFDSLTVEAKCNVSSEHVYKRFYQKETGPGK